MMEERSLLVAFIWIFVIVVSVALFWVGETYVVGIGGPFIASFLLFINCTYWFAQTLSFAATPFVGQSFLFSSAAGFSSFSGFG